MRIGTSKCNSIRHWFWWTPPINSQTCNTGYSNAFQTKKRICKETEHLHCTRTRNLFQCWMKFFSNCVFFTKISNTALTPLRRTKSVTFSSKVSEKHPSDLYSITERKWFNSYNGPLRVAPHDFFWKLLLCWLLSRSNVHSLQNLAHHNFC